ncbi:glycosyltransferase family 4 protein [Halolamina rubra]|uniref:glycosyltransferase family 4 protein n=1 Tax=Halolamina rubra TaxID=1380430 RepID=UPI0009E43CF1|nr:glycosyltransferase family 4 protein [Halolamina rubra]
MSGRNSICFVAYNLYSYFAPDSSQSAGGSERQQHIIATELADGDYDVSAIVGDFGQDLEESFGDISVYRAYKSVGPKGFQSMRGSMRVPIQLFKFFRAMEISNSDIYYTRCSLYYPLLSMYSRFRDISYICGISHDRDVDPEFIKSHNKLVSSVYISSLKNADLVISQTDYQKRELNKHFDVDSIVIPNCYRIRDSYNLGGEYFLWVGRADKSSKSPEQYLQLATNISDEKFLMIVAPGDNRSYYNILKKKAKKISNVEFLGYVPPNRIDNYYLDAKALVNTSKSEGFPNTYLESWSAGTPVVATNCGLNGLVQEGGMGLVCGNVNGLVRGCRSIAENPVISRKFGENGRKYVEKNHSVDNVLNKFERKVF